MLWMLQILNQRIPREADSDSVPLAGFLLRTGGVTLLMGAIAYGIHTGLHTLLPEFQVNLKSLAVGTLTALASMGVYLMVCQRLGVRESDYLRRVLRRGR